MFKRRSNNGTMERTPGHFSDRIIVFGRYPVPGRTKTRLIPALGPAGAADLQRRLTEKTLKTVRAFAGQYGVSTGLCFEGGSAPKIARWIGTGMDLSRQGPGDLGSRMQAAFTDAFKSGFRRVVLTGTDIPHLGEERLKKAFETLSQNDIVLGPSSDGGYGLIGLNGPFPLFHDIDWGSARVCEQTLALAEKGGLDVGLLDPLDDLDTVDDLRRLQPEAMRLRPYVSVIIPSLNEAKNIEKAVTGAVDLDAEVLVVDGGSTDDTKAKARHAGARVLRGPRGRAVQQNIGAASARGGVFLFLHADTRLPAGYVHHVFETLMDPGVALGAFRFKTDWNRPLMRLVEFLTNTRARHLKLPYGDQCLFVRRSLFESVGGFPEVPIAEDLYLARRLLKEGRVVISPACAVTSGRRWQTLGVVRTTLINQIILAGAFFGVVPRLLAPLYRHARGK